MEKTIGVRKGAWTYEEDKLLKACINKYGEGKWHLVPARAGLNRCRKSCRLRWLNYLNPNVKRGSFAEDEVDMILRLHKLLGNRWSLIAGRLPGRTANDVKNYWHTHLLKKVVPNSNKEEENKEKEQPKETKKAHYYHEVIKPQPRTFSTNSSWLKRKQQNNFASDVGVRECAPPPLVASNEDVNVPVECDIETILPTGGGRGGGGDGDCSTQPCPLSAMWWENLWNMEDEVDNEKICPNSLIREQEENSLLEFSKDFLSTEVPTDNDFCWDHFNFSDVNSLLDF